MGAQLTTNWEQTPEGFLTGEGTLEYTDGTLRASGSYLQDEEDGLWKFYYPNGSLETVGYFENGVREGYWLSYHREGGGLASSGHFVEGYQWGVWNYYTVDGALSHHGSFHEGKRTGPWHHAHPDGSPSSEGLFYNDLQVGQWTYHDPLGVRREEVHESLPGGIDYALETWPGTEVVRTEGFLEAGRRTGIWASYHRDGTLRSQGAFVNGEAEGTWLAYAGGQRLAEVQVRSGVPSGAWEFHGDDRSYLREAHQLQPVMIDPQWSRQDDLASLGVETATRAWIMESLRTEVLANAVVAMPGAVARSVSFAATELPELEIPSPDIPFTPRARADFPDTLETYRTGKISQRAASKYAGMRPAQRPSFSGGDRAAAVSYEGKPLPLMEFADSEGTIASLKDLRGKLVVVTVLRGYGSGYCEYCCAQSIAYTSPQAQQELQALGAELRVVLPGTHENLDDLFKLYEDRAGVSAPVDCLLRKEDNVVATVLGLSESMVRPATFVLDENGIVRWCYVAMPGAIEDRPSFKRVVTELKKLKAK